MRGETRDAHDGERNAGAIAQLGERRPCTAEVIGSKPISSTTFASGDSPEEADAASSGEPPGSSLFDNQASSSKSVPSKSAECTKGE